jgi:hypothetical protein
MADLSKSAPLRFNSNDVIVRKWILDNSAAQTVYKGQPMIIDVSEDTVYARVYKDSVTLVDATDVFLGVALEPKSVATTDTETDNEIEILLTGLVGFKNSSLTDADAGKVISMADSGTIAAAEGDATHLEIGRLVYCEDGYAFVMINPGGYPMIQDWP